MIPIDSGMAAINTAYFMLPDTYVSQEATTMLLVIGLQESRFEHRWQIVNRNRPRVMGPARGFWQFEANGGVRGVLKHRSSAFHAGNLCRIFGVKPVIPSVYGALHREDMGGLAAGFARLLLWTDPRPLPALGDRGGAWHYYLNNWRPGKPHLATWSDNYVQALSYVQYV
jgi:hypothetical protein